MWQRLSEAAQSGIVIGVKYGIALVLMLLSVSWILGDYQAVRERARNGQAAFEFLQQQVQRQQQSQSQSQAPVAPKPEEKE